MEVRSYHTVDLNVREATENENDINSIGTLTGYIAVFNSDSQDLGGYFEQIAPGAFANSLQRQDVVALINHERNLVVGRLSAGTLSLREDQKGLAFVLSLPDTQPARDLKTLVLRGDHKYCSFGFNILDQRWSKRSDGMPVCTLTAIDLHEVSVGVTFPCYEATTSQLRMNELKRESSREKAKARVKIRSIVNR